MRGGGGGSAYARALGNKSRLVTQVSYAQVSACARRRKARLGLSTIFERDRARPVEETRREPSSSISEKQEVSYSKLEPKKKKKQKGKRLARIFIGKTEVNASEFE
jgi:Mor family transcriptional regulator